MSLEYFYDDLVGGTNTDNPKVAYLLNSEDGRFIIKGILQGDFSVTISNSFDKSGSTGILGTARDMYNKARTFAFGNTGGVIGKTITVGSEIVSTAVGAIANNKELAGVRQAVDMLNNKIKEGKSFLAKNVEVSDDYLFMFNGSEIRVPLNLQCRLLTSSYDASDDIYEKLQDILEVMIGEYSNVGNQIGLQDPPNGYEPSLRGAKDVFKNPGEGVSYDSDDDKIKGTFQLWIGTDYSDGSKANKRVIIPDVVVTEFSFTESSSGVNTDNGYRPLYIDININLLNVRKLTKRFLKNYIYG